MKINGISKIDSDAGDYLVLVDYHTEGLAVWKQCETFMDALRELTDGHAVGPKAIVKLMAINDEESV